MGIFDLLFPDPIKKIYYNDFKKALRQIPELSDKERLYVEEVFKNDLKDGLSAWEVKQRCQKLEHKPGDILEPEEVKKIREKLLQLFEE
ncbi:MAG: hypothetical protein DRM99_04510 [Thermoplasmata archaeon]|nr:MAG: hypothetical protein DRM99_04510 [Thermoplasmata archaeon]